jgi:hypothetical protein
LIEIERVAVGEDVEMVESLTKIQLAAAAVGGAYFLDPRNKERGPPNSILPWRSCKTSKHRSAHRIQKSTGHMLC